MPMGPDSRAGVFRPHEIEAMRQEFDAGNVPDENAAQRERRAVAIVARRQAMKAEAEPSRD